MLTINFSLGPGSILGEKGDKTGTDPGEVKWVNFHPPPPPFSESLFNHADAQTSNTSTRLWFYYIITKIHPPFQNPGSAPAKIGVVVPLHIPPLGSHRSPRFFLFDPEFCFFPPLLLTIVSFHLFMYQDLHVLERLREYWSVGSNRIDGKVLMCGVDVKKGVSDPLLYWKSLGP